VAVYFIEHDDGSAHARRITIDGLGNLDYWPKGVFSEDFEETRKLAEAQLLQTDIDAG
jgi:predicted ATPase